MDELKSFLDSYFGLIFKAGLVIVILSSLFLFTNLTTEFYDTPKFLVLLVFTLVALTLSFIRFTLINKVVLVRTPLDIPLLLLLAVGIVSTFLSPSSYVSLLGNQLKVYGSLVSLAALVLFYFVLVNNLKGIKVVKWVLHLTVFSSVILSGVSLIAYSGMKVLPSPWTHGINFTPSGSSFSTTAILALLIPFVVIQILSSSKPIFIILNSLFLTLFGITIALTGNLSTWIAGALAFALSVFLSDLRNLRSLRDLSNLKPLGLIGLIVPLAAVVLIIALSFIPPIGGARNPLYTQAKNFPQELQLAFIPAWKISISAFRDMPFWGTGPGTYLFDFTNYKPIEYNSGSSWNLRFDTSFNEYLSVLATLGGVGLLAMLSLTALFITSAFPVILSAAKDLLRMQDSNYKVALAISGLTFFALLLLHPATLVVWIIGLLILASFMVIISSNSSSNLTSYFNINEVLGKTGEQTIKIDALPSILLTIVIALCLVAVYFGGKFTLADYHHRLALNAVAANNGILAYNELVMSEKLNSVSDLYRTDLAQTNFALANAIASAKGPTEASPEGSLTDQDKQNIQVLLQQSINEGRIATTLSPKSAVNWEILALLYRQISGVAQNALVFSLDSYGKAIFQDPLNPILRLNVGGTYYAIKNFDLAIRFFTDSVNLKPDYTNGYYNLSVAYKDKGDLQSALVAAQKVVELLDKNSPDYKVANDYLNELRSKTQPATSSAALAAPTSKDQQALQQKNLPKVVNVGNPPEKIATPPAIKKPNSTPEPTPTP